LKDFREYHTDHSVKFEIEFLEGKLTEMLKTPETFEKKMKLVENFTISNQNGYDENKKKLSLIKIRWTF